jgi:NADH dehydrogenase FAD-containing subunit
VELAFGFKSRWGAVFGQEIEVTLVSAEDNVLARDNEAVRNLVLQKLKEKNIEVLVNGKIKEIKTDGV